MWPHWSYNESDIKNNSRSIWWEVERLGENMLSGLKAIAIYYGVVHHGHHPLWDLDWVATIIRDWPYIAGLMVVVWLSCEFCHTLIHSGQTNLQTALDHRTHSSHMPTLVMWDGEYAMWNTWHAIRHWSVIGQCSTQHPNLLLNAILYIPRWIINSPWIQHYLLHVMYNCLSVAILLHIIYLGEIIRYTRLSLWYTLCKVQL